jgi:diadenosine tetraphosphatase ApaH/serine/threonine PP2A family protein phosphatase
MKLALITDIHANREAFEACFDAACRAGAQGFALLGDFVGYGADPGWVVSQVQSLVAEGAVAVRGNHDEAAVIGPDPSMTGDALRTAEWTHGKLTAEQREFLGKLPYTMERNGLLFAHANLHAPQTWAYISTSDEAARTLKATQARHAFIGHMHDPRVYRLARDEHSGRATVANKTPNAEKMVHLRRDRQWLILPGSAGQPRDGNTAACWALFDTQSLALTLHRQAYDHQKTAAKIVCAGLPRLLAERLLRGQ